MPVSDPANKPSPSLAYLDTSGTAALTGISESTLEKQRLTGGGIPFIKAGRLVKYAVADIHAWMSAHRRDSTSQTVAVGAQQSARDTSAKVDEAIGLTADHIDGRA